MSGPVLAGAALRRARLAAVMVHGRDQDEQVMLDLATRLALDDVAYVLPVSPRRSWYGGRYFDPLAVNEAELAGALGACEDALALVRHGRVEESRTVLVGFSQGACVVAELAARRPRPWAAVAVLTGSLMGVPGARAVAASPAGGLPMLFASSRYDEWVGAEDVRATADAFAGAGARVALELCDDRVHEICDHAVGSLRRMIACPSAQIGCARK